MLGQSQGPFSDKTVSISCLQLLDFSLFNIITSTVFSESYCSFSTFSWILSSKCGPWNTVFWIFHRFVAGGSIYTFIQSKAIQISLMDPFPGNLEVCFLVVHTYMFGIMRCVHRTFWAITHIWHNYYGHR